MSCPPGDDRTFGPRIDPDCRSFDFTLQFEDIFFTCLPAGLFLILSPLRIVPLLRKPILFSVRSNKLLASTQVCQTLSWKIFMDYQRRADTHFQIALTGLIVAQLAFLVLRHVNRPLFETKVSLVADTLSFVATGAALLLSFLSHQRSYHASTLLSLYLSVLVILGIPRTRTVWLLASRDPVPVLMTVTYVLSVVVLLLESKVKILNLVTDEKAAEIPLTPEQSSGFWTRTCFIWLATTLWMGYTKVISVKDLPALDSKLKSSTLHRNLMSTWDKYNRRSRHSLLRACFRSFLFSFLSPIIPRICLSTFTFSQPFLINTTVTFIDLTKSDSNYGKGLIGAWALVYLGIAASNSIYQYQNFRFTTRLRGGLIALVYQRVVQTRGVDMGETTAIALMGTDVERIIRGIQFSHEVWGSLLDIAIASWLLGRQVFLACLAPLILVIIFISITSGISLPSKTAQRRWIEKVQERLRVTTALLGEMKAAKMLGLTQEVSSIVQNLRLDEINTSKAYRKLLVVNLLLSLTPINLAPVITFGIYIIISVFWKNETLLTAQAFTSIALIALLTTPAVVFIQALPMAVQCLASFDRIQDYCNYNAGSEPNGDNTPTVDDGIGLEPSIKPLTPGVSSNFTLMPLQKRVIAFKDESFGWDKKGSAVLKNLQVEIRIGSVTAIVGPIGSGKSAFLNVLLGEMISISTESKKVLERKWGTQTVAYCSQEPWLENGTICHNIIGVSAYDQTWYDNVKWVCDLNADIKQQQKGDATRVGSKGLNLSGGQKQRIALARAIYSRRRVVILDDIFSGMDAGTAEIVSSRLLGWQGLLRKDFMTVVIAAHNHKIMSLADMIITLEDGKIIESGSPAVLVHTNGYVSKLGLSLSSCDNIVEVPEDVGDPEFHRETSHEPTDLAEETDHRPADTRRKNGDISVYRYYLVHAGYTAASLYLIFLIIWIFYTEFSTIWVKWWSEANSTQPNKNVGMYVGIYVMFSVLGIFGAAMAAWFAFVPIISNTAANLHFELLNATFSAPLSFFTTTDSGELLNRFSEDMELVDMDLPMTMVNYTSTAVTFVAQIIVLAVFTRYLGIALPFLGIVLYFIQRFYLQTSRQLRLLGIEARAPLYTHFTESVAGTVSIRAFDWQTHYQKRNYRHIDTSQRPIYLLSCIQAWLAVVLNIVVAALVVVIVGTVVTWHDRFSAGSVGVSLTMIIGFSGTLSRLIQNWTKLESSVGAVARVKQFAAETQHEETAGRGAYIPPEWPQAGALEFAGVTAAYGPNIDPVLRGVSLSILPRQHIAICGRSGSGKTSLILCLLQVIDVKGGKIILDGVDLSTLLQEDLRSRINVIPQDPFLLPGTIRFNIDPSALASDEDITRALERVGLLSTIQNQGGLDKKMHATTLSTGQRQLFCLARAMVKKCKILVIDEVMSSVDIETELIMQEIIDSEFQDSTVLAVMHQLRQVSRYDKVALLDNGALLEYDHPWSLMVRDTRFAEMYRLNAH